MLGRRGKSKRGRSRARALAHRLNETRGARNQKCRTVHWMGRVCQGLYAFLQRSRNTQRVEYSSRERLYGFLGPSRNTCCAGDSSHEYLYRFFQRRRNISCGEDSSHQRLYVFLQRSTNTLRVEDSPRECLYRFLLLSNGERHSMVQLGE